MSIKGPPATLAKIGWSLVLAIALTGPLFLFLNAGAKADEKVAVCLDKADLSSFMLEAGLEIIPEKSAFLIPLGFSPAAWNLPDAEKKEGDLIPDGYRVDSPDTDDIIRFSDGLGNSAYLTYTAPVDFAEIGKSELSGPFKLTTRNLKPIVSISEARLFS